MLKRIHKDLRRKVKASRLVIYMVGVLSEDDEEEIDAKEKAEGRQKAAVDLLLLKLMQLKQPGWQEGFVAGLSQEFPTLVPVVTEARGDLLKETWFSHMSVSSTENQHKCTGEYIHFVCDNLVVGWPFC